MIRTFAGLLFLEILCSKHDATDGKETGELSNFDHVPAPCTFCEFVHKCRVLEACPRYCVRKFYFPIVCVLCVRETSYAEKEKKKKRNN